MLDEIVVINLLTIVQVFYAKKYTETLFKSQFWYHSSVRSLEVRSNFSHD